MVSGRGKRSKLSPLFVFLVGVTTVNIGQVLTSWVSEGYAMTSVSH
jgi:hypothetical protein